MCRRGNLTYDGLETVPLFYSLQDVIGLPVAALNNGIIPEYKQLSPKKRILARLYDIRDKELSEANLKEASKIVSENKIELV